MNINNRIAEKTQTALESLVDAIQELIPKVRESPTHIKMLMETLGIVANLKREISSGNSRGEKL